MTTSESAIKARIAADIEQVREELEGVIKRLPKLNREYDRTQDALHAFHNKPTITKAEEEAARKARAASTRLLQAYAAVAAYRQKLERLHSPDEVERRRSMTERLTALRERSSAMAVSAKDSGVPDVYLGEKGNFRPGMDARYKSDLINSALSLDGKGALETFSPADAEARLEERGWTKFLIRKQEIIEAKEKAQAAKAAEKAKAKAEKEVTPDPKPTKKAKAKK